MFFTDTSFLGGFRQTAALSLRALVDHQRCFSSFFPGIGAVNNCPREDIFGITRFIPYLDPISNPANPDPCGDSWIIIDPEDLFELIEDEAEETDD